MDNNRIEGYVERFNRGEIAVRVKVTQSDNASLVGRSIYTLRSRLSLLAEEDSLHYVRQLYKSLLIWP